MTAHARHLSATQTDQDHRVGVPGPPEPAETVSGPSETLDRDVLLGIARRFWAVHDLHGVNDPGTAVDIVVGHLAPVVAAVIAEHELLPQPEPPAPPETLLDRLRPLTPNGERVLGWAGGTLALGLLLAMIVLVVQGITG